MADFISGDRLWLKYSSYGVFLPLFNLAMSEKFIEAVFLWNPVVVVFYLLDGFEAQSPFYYSLVYSLLFSEVIIGLGLE